MTDQAATITPPARFWQELAGLERELETARRLGQVAELDAAISLEQLLDARRRRSLAGVSWPA